MSGTINSGLNYALLYSNTAFGSSSMLSVIYGSASSGTSSAVSTGNPLTDLKLAQTNQSAEVAQEAKSPEVARDIAAFTAAVSSAKTIQGALLNPSIMKVLLTANNLSSYIQYPALAQKALLSNPSDSTSLVNQLNDSTLLSTAKTYDFATNGLSSLQNSQNVASLTNAYAEVLWRQSLDQATPGLSNALTFLGQASSITTANQILGDATNWAVVTTAFGIPQEIAYQDNTAQQQAVTDKVDISRLQDPKYVTSITDQYLLAMQQQAQSSTSSTDLTTLAVQGSGLFV